MKTCMQNRRGSESAAHRGRRHESTDEFSSGRALRNVRATAEMREHLLQSENERLYRKQHAMQLQAFTFD